MKKLAIVGASAALAAMPVLGVFAVDPVTQEDTITITVPESCELATATGKPASVTKTMSVGTFDNNLEGSTFSVSCNSGETWTLSANGNSDETSKNVLKGSGNGAGHDIASSASPTSNLKVNATTSDWGFKAEGTGAAVESTYQDFAQIPTTSTKIAGGTEIDGTQTVKVTYGVAISGTQQDGTYTGKVTYTLAQP